MQIFLRTLGYLSILSTLDNLKDAFKHITNNVKGVADVLEQIDNHMEDK